ncbi:hypothetical protein C8R44DRAFT_909109 [Mycena epipterygia]|nr:hypothetical protein C8R44DRAFT_909109 [Mycena epipterygia]
MPRPRPPPLPPELALRSGPSPPPAPRFARNYGELADLRLPHVTCQTRDVLSSPYTDLSPSLCPPTFIYPDSDLDREAMDRVDSVITALNLENVPCPDEARTLWEVMWKQMVTTPYTNKDWVCDVGFWLLRIVIALVTHALRLSYPELNITDVVSQPHREHSQQGNKFAAIICKNYISILPAEWKTSPVVEAHLADLGRIDVLPAGQLESGRAIIKKIGLQQASLSREHNLSIRYSIIFTGATSCEELLYLRNALKLGAS